ncbi:hypothetical protein NLJ89_g11501 [Agrocybe chaxingu]|uniref:Uncharacterized protein n=1 Tax=Agrocybe chaxingu TaxID=84603 RepID=A0A9W8MR43_9AGAR|nr:hypothetical protein NLJ89_g11501 [Agrocybe chaxingu]
MYFPCLVSTEYGFQGINVDCGTQKVTSFTDWDTVWILPFLLGARHLTDICEWWGSREHWNKTGCFFFLPVNEEDHDVPDDGNEEGHV